LLKEAYFVFYVLGAIVIAILVCVGLWVDLPDRYLILAWLALPMLLFRSLVHLNQAINRSANNMRRYNTIECMHAVLGFGLGLAALSIIGHEAIAIVLGLLIGAVICTLMDVRLLSVPFRHSAGKLDRVELTRLVNYSWPMVAVAATAMIMQNADRFLLGSFSGTEMLGIFAVAYNLVERPTTLICSSISTATFPLAVQVLEQQGKQTACLQTGRNGIALLAVALPACVGLAVTADYIASSLVGPAFRDGVAALIPIMSFTALASGIRSHFISHAFHLSGRPLQMLWIYVPMTVLNIGLNLYVVPRYGMFGAAWTAFACQWATVVAGWFVGTTLFPIWLPIWQILRTIAAVMPMIAGLTLVRFPLNWFGLFDAILLGCVLYIVSAILLDVGEVRTFGGAALRRRISRAIPVSTD
jgi:O-antigen/teichoic acid export membrane protein